MYSAGQLLAPVVKLILAFPAFWFLMAQELCFEDMVTKLNLGHLGYLQTLQYELCTSLQNSPQTNPIIGRIDRKAGHGAGRPTQKMVNCRYPSVACRPYSWQKPNCFECQYLDKSIDNYSTMMYLSAKVLPCGYL